MVDNKFFIIDFDSTLTQVEALEELAAISLKNNPKKDEILNQIKHITDLGMDGKIPMQESLEQRIKLFKANKKHIASLIKLLKKKITPSFLRNKKFFQTHSNNIFIISNGFKELIAPAVKQLNISERNIYANTFVFNKGGNITGFDKSNILANGNGKAEQLKSLKLDGQIYVIGDGMTDYHLKETGLATKFFAFTENVQRAAAMEKADHIVSTFDEFLYVNKLPMPVSYPKNRIKVLLVENVHHVGVSLLKSEGFNVEVINKKLGEDELAEKIKDVSALGIRSSSPVTQKVLENANRLMAIGAFCVGTTQIDINTCSKKGIAVFNAPYSNTRSVVELAVGCIIMLMRNAFDKSAKLHQGIWDKSSGNEVRGKKLGIIGYGNIGSQLSVLAESLGMEVYFYDIADKLALGNAKKCSSMQELLRKADAVSLHIEGGSSNRNIISEKEFRIMKDGAIILNLSRGTVIDIAALAKYIKNGKIKGAGIDVFPNEPKSSSEEFVSELRGLPNVILTPHIGGSTEEAQRDIGGFVGAKLVDFINNGNTSGSVNFPNMQLPKLQKAHRLIHIHENVPGVLSQINGTLADNKINILGQYLKTNEKIGYVISDVSRQYDKKVINELKKVRHTIKFRALY